MCIVYPDNVFPATVLELGERFLRKVMVSCPATAHPDLRFSVVALGRMSQMCVVH